MNTRRHFLTKLAVTIGTPTLLASHVFGQAPPPPAKLEEADPMAVALGYKDSGSKVDAVKYPQYKPEQKCNGCALYLGKPGDASSPCSAFGGKLVNSAGWCMVFAKKPEPAK